MNKERILEVEKQIKALENELRDSDQIVKDMQARRGDILKKLSSLKNTLFNLKPKNLVVSDHVVLRYLERHYDIPIEAVKKEINDKMASAKNMGDLRFDGFIVKGNVVVSYVPQKLKERK